jgi:hypothetical protein
MNSSTIEHNQTCFAYDVCPSDSLDKLDTSKFVLRSNKSVVQQRLHNAQTTSIKLDRFAYKRRMISNLNIKTWQNTDRQRINSKIWPKSNRQVAAARQQKKSPVDNKCPRIDGNALWMMCRRSVISCDSTFKLNVNRFVERENTCLTNRRQQSNNFKH